MNPTSPLRRFREAVQSSLDPAPDDLAVTDFIISVIASQFLTDFGDPLWGWIIGPPGSMKTEVVRGLGGHSSIVMLSSMTPNSIISGYDRQDGKDPSVLPLFDKKIVVIKEFTSILQLPDAQTKQIFGALRSCYDQKHARAIGTVGIRSYESRFSMLAAVTPRIDKYTLVHTDLGERFIACRIGRLWQSDRSERKRLARHIWNASPRKKEWRATMTQVLHDALTEFQEATPVAPTFTEAQQEEVIEQADLLALMRTIPSDDASAVEPELASRTVQQLRTLVESRAAADRRDTVAEEDLCFMRRIARDTLPAPVVLMLGAMFKMQATADANTWFELGTIAKRSGCTVKWLYQAVGQYAYCHLVQRNNDRVRLSNDFFNRLRHSLLFSV